MALQCKLFLYEEVPDIDVDQVRMLLKDENLTWESSLPNRAYPDPIKNYAAFVYNGNTVVGFMAIRDGNKCSTIVIHPDYEREEIIKLLLSIAISSPLLYAQDPFLNFHYHKELHNAKSDLDVALKLGFKLKKERFAIPDLNFQTYIHNCGHPEPEEDEDLFL